jgi:uncharacterized protein YndB with AHSA1/START domain
MTERGVIRLSQFINLPPAKVWQALTEPGIHAKWWATGDVKAVVGHRFTRRWARGANSRVRSSRSNPGVC